MPIGGHPRDSRAYGWLLKSNPKAWNVERYAKKDEVLYTSNAYADVITTIATVLFVIAAIANNIAKNTTSVKKQPATYSVMTGKLA